MRLWNDYEGKTIDDFPIETLIRPEGRSAFFSTTNGTGKPAVMRLIEAINDEDEILDRWKLVSSLQQNHLIAFKKFGQAVIDGTPLIYAVMEPNDADLSQILRERPLTVEETRQVATSLVEALQSLHAANIIHEHIEPANVLAAGDTVKLRSDCIREAPDEPEGSDLKARDVHDLAVVLLQCLTQHPVLNGNVSKPFPAPFDQIIRNGINFTWGLPQIAAALTPPAVVQPPAAPAVTPTPAPSATPASSTPPTPVATSAPTPIPAPAATFSTPAPAKPAKPAEPPAQARLPLDDFSPAAVAASIPPAAHIPRYPSVRADRLRLPIEADPKRKRLWVASAAAAILVALPIGWHYLHTEPAAAPAQPITTLPNPKPSAAKTTTPTKPGAPRQDSRTWDRTTSTRPTPAPAKPTPTASQPPVVTPEGRPQWRVIAFTYNQENPAWKKAATLGREHPDLHPEVFSATGHAPYLVTVGGVMTREQAFALRDKLRSSGLPRDTYAQNYSGAH